MPRSGPAPRAPRRTPGTTRRCRLRWVPVSRTRSCSSLPCASRRRRRGPGRTGGRPRGYRAVSRRAARGHAGHLTTARWPPDAPPRSGEPVVGVRDGPRPYRLERLCAHFRDCWIVGQLILEELAVAREVAEPNQLPVEHPEIVQGDADVSRAPSWQPPDVLARRDVDLGGERMLEPDVIGERLGHDACPPEPGAPGYMGADQFRPGGVRRNGDWLAGQPPDEPLVVRGVGVAGLQMDR